MKKLIMFNLMTLDGYFEGPNADISWHNFDEEVNDFSITQLRSVDLLFFGRVTYQLMAGYWPTPESVQDDPVVASLMNTTPKVVFSRTLASADWENTRLVKSDAAGEIRRLKEQPGMDIALFGSANLAASLAGEGVIDEYRILINPLVLAGGNPLFKPQAGRLELELIDSRIFKNGNVLLVYKPLKTA